MAQIDDTIATYLTAIEVEGKTQNTVLSYRAALEVWGTNIRSAR